MIKTHTAIFKVTYKRKIKTIFDREAKRNLKKDTKIYYARIRKSWKLKSKIEDEKKYIKPKNISRVN